MHGKERDCHGETKQFLPKIVEELWKLGSKGTKKITKPFIMIFAFYMMEVKLNSHFGSIMRVVWRGGSCLYSHFTTSYGSVMDPYLINSSSPTVTSKVIILHHTASFSSPLYSTFHIPSHYCASLSYQLPILPLSFDISFMFFSPSIIIPASLPFASFQLRTSPHLLVMCCSFNSHCVVWLVGFTVAGEGLYKSKTKNIIVKI